MLMHNRQVQRGQQVQLARFAKSSIVCCAQSSVANRKQRCANMATDLIDSMERGYACVNHKTIDCPGKYNPALQNLTESALYDEPQPAPVAQCTVWQCECEAINRIEWEACDLCCKKQPAEGFVSHAGNHNPESGATRPRRRARLQSAQFVSGGPGGQYSTSSRNLSSRFPSFVLRLCPTATP